MSRPGAAFLLTDLDLAFTFLDVARTTKSSEIAARNQRNARAAYDAVLRFLPKSHDLTRAERRSVEDKLGRLKLVLEDWGETF